MDSIVLDIIKEQLRNGEPVSIKAGGNCMKPVIRSGAVVTIDARDEWNEGDIVAYATGKCVKVHRLIAKNGNELFMSSDTMNPGMHTISNKDVIGKVTGIRNPTPYERVVGRLRNTFKIRGIG